MRRRKVVLKLSCKIQRQQDHSLRRLDSRICSYLLLDRDDVVLLLLKLETLRADVPLPTVLGVFPDMTATLLPLARLDLDGGGQGSTFS